MPNIIYNEGRVVGFSAYEIYLRQHLSELGETVPVASEREWLSSMLAGGSALLIKIPSGISNSVSHSTGWRYLDIAVPNASRLCAANVITGHLFEGHGNYSSGSYFATSVADYGDLVANTSSTHPVANVQAINSTTVPPTDVATSLDEFKEVAILYSKIIDGVAIQPGRWSVNQNASNGRPAYYLHPDLVKVPTIRLKIAVQNTSDFNHDVEILLVGWTNRSVVAGEVGLDTAEMSGTSSPSDGDFLGPATFPWASKIVFTAPSYAMYQVHEHLNDIEDEIDGLESDIKAIPRFDAEYAPFTVQSGSSPYTEENIPNSVLVVHKKFVDGNDTPYYALSLKNRTESHKSSSINTINVNPDGYIYWEDLIPALHKQFNSGGSVQHGRVDALTAFLRQLNESLIGSPAGQYVINIENNSIALSPYIFSEDDMIKQKINLILTLDNITALGNDYGMYYTNVGNTDTYHDTANTKPLFAEAKLDLFGYLATYNNGNTDPTDDTTVLNMLATLTLVASPYTFDQPCVAWAQRFSINDSVNLVSILQTVLELRKSTTNTGSNTLLLATGGRPVLRTASTIWDGSPLVHMDVAAYINLSTIASQLNAWETDRSSHGKIVKITGAISSNPGNAHIEGIIYGNAVSAVINPFGAGSNVATCAVNGSLAMSSKTSSGYKPNSGTIQGVTAVFEDKTTDTRNISLV